MKLNTQTPTGTHDILPSEQKYWKYLIETFEKRSRAFGLEKIDTPIFEYKSVFTRSIGEATDIVEKEMFEIKKAGEISTDVEREKNETLILRPEGTAGVVRAYIEHGMHTWSQPVKLYYFGSMFRYDRPQKGRFRQFNQAGIEIIGDAEPLTDALAILLLWQIFSDLGLGNDIMIVINSIGCKTCRGKYIKKLMDYYRVYERALCPDCLRRKDSNPLRLLDCKQEKCQEIANAAPQIIDHLCPECKSHFMKVLEYLDELNISYDLNPRLVRGLDYYTRTTFELCDKNDNTRQSVLGGGGRYDDLVEILGGAKTPAVGWSLGLERIIEKIKEKQIEVPQTAGSDIFIVQLGEKARKHALALVAELTRGGYNASCVLGKASLKAQLRSADKMGAKITLILGQREVLDNSIIVRDMAEASQENIPINKLDRVLEKYFKIQK